VNYVRNDLMEPVQGMRVPPGKTNSEVGEVLDGANEGIDGVTVFDFRRKPVAACRWSFYRGFR
jgi:hypothetical protein